MSVITTPKALENFCRSLEKTDYIALDTEFIRENTYYPNLCLIQIAGPKEASAIDPLAKGMDLGPFFALLENKKLLKVMHAARQDVEIFYNLTGKVPAPMFDTQIAAMVCGYGESVGYEPLANKLTGASIDKSQRFTDWARRPLSERQIEYALSDVTHLRPVYEKLVKQIEAEDRMAWIKEEMSGLYEISRYETDPSEMWQRLKYRSRSPKFLATLRELAKWRELEARQLNIPRGRVIKDESLVELAGAAPKTLEDLQKIRGFPSGLAAKRKQALLDIIEAARNMNPKDCPQVEHKKPLPEGTSALVELLKVLLRMKSEEHGVASRLIASKEDLEAMAIGNFENLPAMSGWRHEVFGQHAEALMKGKIALSSDPKNHAVKLRAIG